MKCIFCDEEGGKKPEDRPDHYPICDKCTEMALFNWISLEQRKYLEGLVAHVLVSNGYDQRNKPKQEDIPKLINQVENILDNS